MYNELGTHVSFERHFFVLYDGALTLKMSKSWCLTRFAMYGTGKKKRLSYLVGNLVATNWPIEKTLHAIGYNQIPTK